MKWNVMDSAEKPSLLKPNKNREPVVRRIDSKFPR